MSHASASPIPQGTSSRPIAPVRGPSYNTTAQTPQSSYANSQLNTNLNNKASLANTLSSTTYNNNNNRYTNTTSSISHPSTIQPYAPYTSGITNYKAPQPVEVWSLNDAANASIPPDIRHQFRCDDAGRVLFFTAPPVEFAEQDSTVDAPLLGHSIEYTASKIRRTAELEERKKRRAEAQVEKSEKRQKIQEEQIREFSDKVQVLLQKAVTALETQLKSSPETGR